MRTRVRRAVNAMLDTEHRHATPEGFQRAKSAFISRAYHFETGTAGLQFNRLSRVCIKHVSRMYITRQDPLFNAPAYTLAQTCFYLLKTGDCTSVMRSPSSRRLINIPLGR